MGILYTFIGVLMVVMLMLAGISDAQTIETKFNEEGCSDGRVVCQNDPLLYTCTVTNSGSDDATVTLPNGVGFQVNGDNTAVIVGASSLPDGITNTSHDGRVVLGVGANFSISLSIERAALLNNNSITCDSSSSLGGTLNKRRSCPFSDDQPDPPQELAQNVELNTESSVVIEWRSPRYTGGNGITISNYTVSISGGSISGVRSETVSGGDLSFNFTGLDNDTLYAVSVATINSCGLSSSPSNISIFSDSRVICSGCDDNVTCQDGELIPTTSPTPNTTAPSTTFTVSPSMSSDSNSGSDSSTQPDTLPIIVGCVVGGVLAITIVVLVVIIVLCVKKKRDGGGKDQQAIPLSATTGAVSPGPSEVDSGPMYQAPNTISRTAHPETGEMYTDVTLKTKKDDQGQDPSSIEHQTAPGGEMYAMPQKKSGKKEETDDGLTEEEKAAMYSVPDKKGQKAKSQGLLYADISIGPSSRPAPPSAGSNYADIQHNN